MDEPVTGYRRAGRPTVSARSTAMPPAIAPYYMQMLKRWLADNDGSYLVSSRGGIVTIEVLDCRHVVIGTVLGKDDLFVALYELANLVGQL